MYSRTAEDTVYNFPDHGEMCGCPGVAVTAGSADIYSFQHYAMGAQNCHLYMTGDSITAGVGASESTKFAELVRVKFDARQVHVSGWPGAIVTGAMNRMIYELAQIRPKYIFIYLGSNHGGESDLAALVALAQARCETVIVATVPTEATITSAINALGSDIKKVAFDLALTATGAGSTVIAGYYSGDMHDDLHPNDAGNLQMFRRIALDAPEIFR